MVLITLTAVFNSVLAELKPVQRWNAAGGFGDNWTTERWFILSVLSVVFVLTALFVVLNFLKARRDKKASRELFVTYARKLSLGSKEFELMVKLANSVQLNRKDTVFTVAEHFEAGAAEVIAKAVASGDGAAKIDELKNKLQLLRVKLGFGKHWSDMDASFTGDKKLSSRLIPVGRQIHLKRQSGFEEPEIEAIVVENDDLHLSLKVETPVRVSFSDFWMIRYYYKAAIWEFESSTVSYDGGVLVISHSDNVRFVNRRRFSRVPVTRPGFVARYPFVRSVEVGARSKGASLNKDTEATLGPPEFVPAVVTELGGPGLRMEVPFELSTGERVLVVFRLDCDKVGGTADDKQAAGVEKVIGGVGVVRKSDAGENGYCVGVELIGYSDMELDELVRATNLVSINTTAADQMIEGYLNDGDEQVEQKEAQGYSL